MLVLIFGCVERQVPHAGADPVFALVGAHAVLPCAGCHGLGTPERLPTDCASCHAPPDPGHHPGDPCDACHTPSGWAAVATTDPTTIPTDEPSEHPPTGPDALCWDCHEEDRKSADHYTDPDRWDCAPCHLQTSWDAGQVEHPVRTPHGGADASTGVVACASCHPSGPPAYVCSDCHASIFPHYGAASAPGPAADLACLGCHPTGIE